MVILSHRHHLSVPVLEKSFRKIAPLFEGCQYGLSHPDSNVCQAPAGLFKQRIPFLLIVNLISVFQKASGLI